MAVVEVLIPMTLPSAANLREHWAKRATRASKQRSTAGWALMSDGGCSLVGAAIGRGKSFVVTLHRVGKRQLDDDNLQSAFKSVRDGVADALGIKDNNPLVKWNYEQSTGKACAVTIRIEEV